MEPDKTATPMGWLAVALALVTSLCLVALIIMLTIKVALVLFS